MKDISVLLVGIGGYGNQYVRALLEEGEQKGIYIVGAVDPRPESCRYLDALKAKKIPIMASIEDFYASKTADLTIISSPIHFHCEQTCFALTHGSHVLCEKPAAATIQEIQQMIDTRDKMGLLVGIGFQWSYSPIIHALKNDINAGLFGKPKRLKSIVLWPRNKDYYERGGGWAGQKQDKRGHWVLDSVANNATAHYLHNMLYVLGHELDRSIKPVKVTAELYRANSIENFDTGFLRVFVEDNVEVLFYASHAVNETIEPRFCYEFEKASIFYRHPDVPQSDENIVAVFSDGSIKEYGNPDRNRMQKLWTMVDAIRGNIATIPCGLETATSHTISINGAQESMPHIVDFPSELIHKEGEPTLTWVEGLADIMKQCYALGCLPSDLNVSWAKTGKSITVTNYNFFKGDGQC